MRRQKEMNMNNTKIELNTDLVRGLFSGTYNTAWEVHEYADNGDEQYIEYDNKAFMQTIAQAYHGHEQAIIEALNIPFIKNIHFTGSFYSPREYNFATDSLDFTLTINRKAMLAVVEELATDEAFNAHLQEQYTSYDGFMSFTPNNYKELKQALVTRNNRYEQAIGALIQYLAWDILNTDEWYASIEGAIHEDWSCNGYGGLDYETQCPSCYKPVEYTDNGTYPCTNKQCEDHIK